MSSNISEKIPVFCCEIRSWDAFSHGFTYPYHPNSPHFVRRARSNLTYFQANYLIFGCILLLFLLNAHIWRILNCLFVCFGLLILLPTFVRNVDHGNDWLHENYEKFHRHSFDVAVAVAYGILNGTFFVIFPYLVLWVSLCVLHAASKKRSITNQLQGSFGGVLSATDSHVSYFIFRVFEILRLSNEDKKPAKKKKL